MTTKSAIERINRLQNSSCIWDVTVADSVAWNIFDIEDSLSLLVKPVLLMRGQDDMVITRTMLERTSQKLKNCEIIELEGTGPWPSIENPHGFIRAIQSFLSQYT